LIHSSKYKENLNQRLIKLIKKSNLYISQKKERIQVDMKLFQIDSIQKEINLIEAQQRDLLSDLEEIFRRLSKLKMLFNYPLKK
jgi:hypothetical protein